MLRSMPLATLSVAAAVWLAGARAGADTPEPAAAPPAIARETAHLSLRASLSSPTVAPGERLSIAVDVTPKPGMHVYAPGSDYRPVSLVLDPHSGLHAHDAVYPEPSLYLFEPLNEAVLVYSAPFRLTRAITAGRTAAERAKLRREKTLTIAGRIEYQACDDRVCYLPVSVPVSWTIPVTAAAPPAHP